MQINSNAQSVICSAKTNIQNYNKKHNFAIHHVRLPPTILRVRLWTNIYMQLDMLILVIKNACQSDSASGGNSIPNR